MPPVYQTRVHRRLRSWGVTAVRHDNDVRISDSKAATTAFNQEPEDGWDVWDLPQISTWGSACRCFGLRSCFPRTVRLQSHQRWSQDKTNLLWSHELPNLQVRDWAKTEPKHPTNLEPPSDKESRASKSWASDRSAVPRRRPGQKGPRCHARRRLLPAAGQVYARLDDSLQLLQVQQGLPRRYERLRWCAARKLRNEEFHVPKVRWDRTRIRERNVRDSW